jgi:hypothetical protein
MHVRAGPDRFWLCTAGIAGLIRGFHPFTPAIASSQAPCYYALALELDFPLGPNSGPMRQLASAGRIKRPIDIRSPAALPADPRMRCGDPEDIVSVGQTKRLHCVSQQVIATTGS